MGDGVMKHCLIVDDSNSIRKVASRILEDMSFRTSEANTAAAALQVCRSEMPDCIVVDWQMPDCDGLALMAEMRKLPGGDQPQILYLTSENDRVQIARAVRSGANGYMMKPFDGETVARAMAGVGMI